MGVVPVVHRRDPRAAQRPLSGRRSGAREVPVGPPRMKRGERPTTLVVERTIALGVVPWTMLGRLAGLHELLG